MLTAGLTHCNQNQPTTNPVQSTTIANLDRIISANDFRGLVVAMASWCPPCREELPILSELYRKYREKGIRIIAVSLDEKGPQAVQPLINKLQIPFPVYWIGPRAAKHYGIVGIPTTMIFDQGKLKEKLPGAHPARTIEKKIQTLVTGRY